MNLTTTVIRHLSREILKYHYEPSTNAIFARGIEKQLGIWQLSAKPGWDFLGIHPGKLTWSVKITCLKRKNHLPNLHFCVPNVNFQGCISPESTAFTFKTVLCVIHMYRHTGATHLAKGGGSFIDGTHQDDIRLLVFVRRVRGCMFELLLIFGEEGLEVPLKSLEEVLFLRRAYIIDIQRYLICYLTQHMHTSTATYLPRRFPPNGFLTWDWYVWFPRPSLEKSGRWHRRWHLPGFLLEGLIGEGWHWSMWTFYTNTRWWLQPIWKILVKMGIFPT